MLLGVILFYLTLVAVASWRYQSKKNHIEQRGNAVFGLLSTRDFKKALSRVTQVQNMPCPWEPKGSSPYTVFGSLFFNDYHPQMAGLMKTALERRKSDLGGTTLAGAYLRYANLVGAGLMDADLSGADLSGAHLGEADLRGARLIDANLEGATLKGANLETTRLEKASLKYAYLKGANLQGADLTAANLLVANLWGVNLNHARLRKANLQRANLEDAQMISADFSQANLQHALLKHANLKHACFRSADLKFTPSLTVEQICSAKTLYSAKLDPELLIRVQKACPGKLKNPAVREP